MWPGEALPFVREALRVWVVHGKVAEKQVQGIKIWIILSLPTSSLRLFTAPDF